MERIAPPSTAITELTPAQEPYTSYDSSILQNENPDPISLVNFHRELHRSISNHNELWSTHVAQVTLLAQTIVNRGNETSRPAFILFREAGIDVTWPNIFLRVWYSYIYAKRLGAEKNKSLADLAKLRNRELEIEAQLKIAQYEVIAEKKRRSTVSAERRMQAEKMRAEKEKLSLEARIQLIALNEKITELKVEKRSPNTINDIIGEYNTLLESAKNDLNLAGLERIDYMEIPRQK